MGKKKDKTPQSDEQTEDVNKKEKTPAPRTRGKTVKKSAGAPASAAVPEKTAPNPTAAPGVLAEAEAIAAEAPREITGTTAAPEAIAPAVAEPPQPVMPPVIYHKSLMTDDDVYLFNEGSHFNLYNKLGAQIV